MILLHSLLHSQRDLEEINQVHLATLSKLAKRATIVLACAFLMAGIQPIYNTSYSYALSVFLEYVRQAGRLVGPVPHTDAG